MNLQAIYDEHYNTARTVLDDLGERYMTNSTLKSPIIRLQERAVIKTIQCQVLRQILKEAEDGLKSANCEYRDALNLSQRRYNSRCPTLPAEIVQYIVSLAYDNETREIASDRWSSFYNACASGARCLPVTDKLDVRTRNFLLASTILSARVSSDDFMSLESVLVDYLNRPKLRLTIDSPREKGDEVFRVLQILARRVVSLSISIGGDLRVCLPALQYVTHLSLITPGVHISELEWNKLREAVQCWEHIHLRSASVTSEALPRFVSSGLLKDISELHLELKINSKNVEDSRMTDQFYFLNRVFDVLSLLQRLAVLRIRDATTRANGVDSDTEDVFKAVQKDFPLRNVHLVSLRSLEVSFFHWYIADVLIRAFSGCPLTTISFVNHPRIPFIRKKCFCKLSGSLPHLEILRIPTVNLRSLLYKCSDCHHDGTGVTWNFPSLHTLDLSEAMDFDAIDPNSFVRIIGDRNSCGSASAINCLYMDNPTWLALKVEVSKWDRVILCYQLERLIPNLIWREDLRTLKRKYDPSLPLFRGKA